MSRIGRLPIPVPSGVDIAIDGRDVVVKGPKGTLTHTLAAPITIERVEDGTLQVARPNDEQKRGSDLEFALGFSHPVVVPAPEGITFAVETPTRFTVSGIDKQQVGEVAAKIRKLRKPDPYKGKGVRYQGEVVRRKVGKTGK